VWQRVDHGGFCVTDTVSSWGGSSCTTEDSAAQLVQRLFTAIQQSSGMKFSPCCCCCCCCPLVPCRTAGQTTRCPVPAWMLLCPAWRQQRLQESCRGWTSQWGAPAPSAEAACILPCAALLVARIAGRAICLRLLLLSNIFGRSWCD
jgi:hypothetical protein